jgi:hypothetical protein
MNEPAHHFLIRLSMFQNVVTDHIPGNQASRRTVAPPATYRPVAMASAASASNSREGWESASMKSSHSPVAAAAPQFRARAIWLIGSNTTRAPSARAISAVRSVELLSHTINSVSQPRSRKADAAAWMLRNEAPSSFSSL